MNASTTSPSEFKKFHNLLMISAPADYAPWYIILQKLDKAPVKGISWKTARARLTYEQAISKLSKGYNIGIAGRNNDLLQLIDFDNSNTPVKPETLTVATGKKYLSHQFVFAKNINDKINHPTEKNGELRGLDQYVVACGSCVPSNAEQLTMKVAEGSLTRLQADAILEDPKQGVYKIKYALPPKINWTQKDLPDVFKQDIDSIKHLQVKAKTLKENKTFVPITSKNGARHPIFDLTFADIFGGLITENTSHPHHDSTTGSNFSQDVKRGYLHVVHCWRHMVTLTPVQYLAMASGYCDCRDAGKTHAGGGAGSSVVNENVDAINSAIDYAKSMGYLSKYVARYTLKPEENVLIEFKRLNKLNVRKLEVVADV